MTELPRSADLVQAIAIPKGDHAHEDVVKACALASVKAMLETAGDPSWAQWLSGPFTKTVRRGTTSQVLQAFEFQAASAECGDTVAMAFKPMTYEDFPKCISKMQVSGTDYPRRGSWESPSVLFHRDPMVVINPGVEMTTGKLAAQVAHGLMAVMLRADASWVNEWVKRDYPWGCWVADEPREWDNYVGKFPIHINDAGHTEVDPGTLTVVAQ